MSEPATPCKQTERGAAPADGRAPLLDPATPSGAALRTTVACVIAMALAFALHVQVPALAVVFVLARGNAGAITMLVGASAGSALAIALLALFDQSRVAFSLVLFAASALATHAALTRRFPYAYVQGLLSCLIVVGQALDAPDGAELHVFYGLASVAIAAFAAFVAGASQPVMVPAQLQGALASHLRSCAALLRACGSGGSSALVLRLELSSRRLHALLAASSPTRQVTASRRRALAGAVAHADELLQHVLALDGWARHAPSADAPAGARSAAAHAAAALACAIDRVAPLLSAPRGALTSDRRPSLRAARLLAHEVTALAPAEDATLSGLAAAIVPSARRVLGGLVGLAPYLPPGAAAELLPGDAPQPPWRRRSANRFHVRHSVKSAASYLLVLWAWVAADWGAVVPALVVSVLVATLATPLGATLRKAVLRVGGVLAGGIAGLLVAVLLLPYVTTLPAICTIAGLVLLGFLWIQQHSERLVFAALQAAIAFTLTLVHGTGPSPTWREPLESLIGLAFGIVVVVTVMHAVWPIDATTSARSVLADLLRVAASRVRTLARDASRAVVPGLREQLVWMQPARELAAGFVHEVELYGTQFGRPVEDLAGALRATLELDAVLALAAAARADGTSTIPARVERARAAVVLLLERACRAAAVEIGAHGLAPVDLATKRALHEACDEARALGADLEGFADARFAQALALAAVLLLEVHETSVPA